MTDATGPQTPGSAGTDVSGSWPHELDDEYEYRGELGRGGMAVVYRARERALGRDVAIKVVRPRFHADEESVARLAREARTVAQLEHPNIVSLHAVKRLTNGLALVMQLVPGHTLKAALSHGPLSPNDAAQVLRDISRALAYAHRCGVVHRDVKPENIFLDEITGRALLSDFGVARSIEENTELTATGTAIGTPTYMSPEQIDGGHLDGRSDLYSLGMVGWEMLTGQRPWAGESLYSVIYRQKHDPLPPLDAIRPEVPQRLQYLIEGLMHKNPERRWISAARFLALLANEESVPGFKEWQAMVKKRRKSSGGGGRSGTSRSPSPIAGSPAVSTVRFRRGEDGSLSPADLQAINVGDPDATQRLTPTPGGHFAIAAEDAEAPPRNRLTYALGASVLAVAAIAYALFGRGLVEAKRPIAGPTAMSDQRQIVVPVVTPPNSLVVAGSTPQDSIGALAPTTRQDSTPAAATPSVDSARAIAPAAVPAVPPSSATRRDSARLVPPSRTAPTPPPTTIAPPPGSATTIAPPPTAPSTTPSGSRVIGAAVAFPSERSNIAAGGRHSCMLDDNGRAVCWGNNERGQLGDGSFDDHATAAPVSGDFTLASISAGVWHTCGVTRDGDAFCWGSNDAGQLGDGTTTVRAAPVRVSGSLPLRYLRTGQSHTCALSRGGSVLCWGANSKGQVGDGSRATRTAPVTVSLGAPAGAIAVGRTHSCALAIDGVASCWGQNDGGQLGDGTTTDRAVPTQVFTEKRFVAIAAGATHTCAIATDGGTWCWGKSTYGQLGLGSTVDAPTPQLVDAPAEFQTITAGQLHTCARTREGKAYCWGRNIHGQLGDGSTTDRSRPVAVRASAPFVSINASGAHTCGVTTTGDGFCWGYNIDGQLGGGDRNNANVPSRVAGASR